ncbi:MAG: hypothetical protein KF713_00040 [Turneriella sp.]|nr:hypothetical protein [Turneriella sp.]
MSNLHSGQAIDIQLETQSRCKWKRTAAYLAAFTLLFSVNCVTHTYTVKPEQKTIDTKFTTVTYGFFRFYPRMAKLDAHEMCEGGKVSEVTLYDSGLDGLLCGITILMYCPKTVKVACYE